MLTRRERVRSRYPFGPAWDRFERRVFWPFLVIFGLWVVYATMTGLRGQP